MIFTLEFILTGFGYGLAVTVVLYALLYLIITKFGFKPKEEE